MNVVLSSVPLYLLPLSVVLGALATLALGGARGARATSRPPFPLLVGLVGALVVLLVGARPLLGGARVFSHALRIARVGSVDANLSFWLDRDGFVIALAVIIAALLFALARPRRALSSASHAGVGIAAAGLLVAALGDGFPSLLMGWTTFGVASAIVLGGEAPKSGYRALTFFAGSAVLVAIGAALVFWCLGGRFLDGRRYLSDYRAPFAASSKVAGEAALPNASTVHAPSIGERGSFTMVTHPGAKVYLGIANESQLTPRNSEPFAISPVVRAELPAGLQKVAIETGGGSIIGGDGREIALIEQVRFPAHEEVEIRSQGSSLTFREIDAELATNPSGFAERQLGTFRLVDAACAFFALGALGLAIAMGRASREARSARSVAFTGAGALLLAASFSTRMASIFGEAPGVASAAAIVSLLVALHAAVRSLRAFSAAAFLADGARALVALVVTLTALSLGAAAISLSVGSAFALLALGILVERNAPVTETPAERAIATGVSFGRRASDATALALGAIGLAGAPIPVAGTFLGIGAIGIAALVRGGAAGVVIALLAAATWAALAHASYRAYFCISHAPETIEVATDPPQPTKKRSKKRPVKTASSAEVASNETPSLDRFAWVLGLVSCLAGPIAAFALGALGEPSGLSLVARVLVYVAMAAAPAVTGHLARKRYAEGRASHWIASDQSGLLGAMNEQNEEDEPAPTRPGAVGRLVLAMDRAFDGPLDALAGRAAPAPKDEA